MNKEIVQLSVFTDISKGESNKRKKMMRTGMVMRQSQQIGPNSNIVFTINII